MMAKAAKTKTLTDVANLTKEQQRNYFQFKNAAFTVYNPGRQVMLGLRGRF